MDPDAVVIPQAHIVGPKTMVGLAGGFVQVSNHFGGTALHGPAVIGMTQNANQAVFGEGAGCPSVRLIVLEPSMRPLVMDMISIKQGNEQIDIKQGAHQMPSSSIKWRTCSGVMTSPRRDKTLKPWR